MVRAAARPAADPRPRPHRSRLVLMTHSSLPMIPQPIRAAGSGTGGASRASYSAYKLLPGGYVRADNRARRCPDDHVSCGQVDAQSGQPGDHADLHGDAGDAAASQNKRASVRDCFLYPRVSP